MSTGKLELTFLFKENMIQQRHSNFLTHQYFTKMVVGLLPHPVEW